MKIEKDRIVKFTYKLFIFPGTLIEEVPDDNPVFMMHGSGPWPQAFFDKMEGFEAGSDVSFTLTPEEGFGKHDPKLIREVPRENLEKIEGLELEAGITLPVLDQESGQAMYGTVTEVKEEVVLLDFNHPLADQTLMFEGKILEVREAKPSELATGKIDDVTYTDVNPGGEIGEA